MTDAPDLDEVLAGVEEIGLELLLAWIADGPPRPPDSREELHAWAKERGLLVDANEERS